MIKCIVIDDEPLAIDLLKDFISKVPTLFLETTFLNAVDALAYTEANPVDLIFLDIQMPDLNGIEFIKNLKSKPKLVLTTAYQQFAIEGYNFDVVGFLVKPISFSGFLNVVRKVEEQLLLKSESEANGVKGNKFLFVRTEYKLVKINFEDILYVEGMKDYSKIYIVNTPKAIITLQNLKSFEEKLPPSDFVRVHRSYIISVNRIDVIHKNSIFIGAVEIPVSEGFKGQLNKIITKYT